ncbi:unnamed protein product [Adineta ricciae]|uniref:Uncharacterized protein n=1 Tax=Adineta ricciae TaxID=249248 RepID=A0A815LCC2_ADIRI|nr:unnamed protein product [Adineta ricciae]
MLLIILINTLSIAALCVGLERQSQCPIQTKIPIWLIVYGAFGVFTSVFTIITGSVWVFKVKSSVQFTDPTILNTYCEKHTFNFAFGLILFMYSSTGLFCCCVCCLGCLFAFVLHDDD